MLLLAVVEQALAMVGGHGQDHLVEEATSLQALEQPAEELVRVADLSVVGVRPAMTLGRGVGGVRLVEVEEGEEPRVALRLDPARQRLDGHGPVAGRGER